MAHSTPVLYNQRALIAALELIMGCSLPLGVGVENDADGFPCYVVRLSTDHTGPLLRTFEGIPIRYTRSSVFQ